MPVPLVAVSMALLLGMREMLWHGPAAYTLAACRMLSYSSQMAQTDVGELLAAAAAARARTNPNQLSIAIPEHEIEPGKDKPRPHLQGCASKLVVLPVTQRQLLS